MAKNNKNKSRQLDVYETPEYQAEVTTLRNGWAADFERFCAEKLIIIDKTATGTPARPFQFNGCQKALTALVDRIGDFQEMKTRRMNERDPRVQVVRYPVEVVILKARKVGVSTWCEARAYWKMQFWRHQKGLVMAHERPAAQNIMDIMQRFETQWPANEYPITKAPIERMSDDLMEWHADHGSSMVVETAGSKGSGSSRSFSYHVVHISEMAHFPPDSPQLSSALSARMPYHETYLESTANGTGNMFYDDWSNAMWIEDVERLWREGKPTPKWWNGKFRFFWPWFAQDENRVFLEDYERKYVEESLTETEQELIAEHELDIEQIAWRRREIAGPCSKQNTMPPEDFFKQEHPATPEEAFVSKSQSIFDTKKLNAMAKAAKEITPVYCGFLYHDPTDPVGFKLSKHNENAYVITEHGDTVIEGAQFVQWELPRADEAYVMGIDTAEGLEHGDWTVIVIFSRTNGTAMREVARLRSKTPAREAGEIAYYLGHMYNEAYIVAERNTPGNSLCEKLVELGYWNMYHHRNIETVTNHDNPEAFTAGFKTTSTTKPMICERGVQAIRDDEIILRHPDAIREWKVFARNNKKYGAPDGMNDDCVMADLLALFGMSEAPQLSASQTTAVERDPNMTPEQIDNAYWAKRSSEHRDRCAAENARRAAHLLQRSVVRRSPRDVFSN